MKSAAKDAQVAHTYNDHAQSLPLLTFRFFQKVHGPERRAAPDHWAPAGKHEQDHLSLHNSPGTDSVMLPHGK